MKFLLDAQLPKKVSLFLEWKGFDSLHTLDLPMKNKTTDSEINRISIEEKRVVITKDLDFIESFLVSNKPYKLIYISTGNISNKKLLEIFSENIDLIMKYIENNSFIEITNNNIIIRK
jgi:predicted nuclease of predicted toxin-antitoxin system